MAIVLSAGELRSFGGVTSPPDGVTIARGSGTLDSLSSSTYAQIYRTQQHVRTVVDFLARNIAQLGIHAYRRISDLDRERLANYELLDWLEHPTPATCRYKLIETLVQDLGIYFRAYWLKLRRTDGRLGLLRLSPETIVPNGWLLPSGYTWTLPNNETIPIAVNDIVSFHGFDPNDALMAVSPLETLRQILMEDCASSTYRRAYWSNSARLEGVITRPKDAPKWTPPQKQAFREQWQARYAGNANAGQTAVLEDGMTFTPTSYSARDSELNASRKLTREEVAAAYHVPQPMVGILDHATYSNIREQHKQLYQDCLGPWLIWIVEELERQVLPECSDTAGVYLEFNIAEKLKGSFEEQASSIYSMVGRPVMTANEGRARLNLPRIKDDPSADNLVLPLNTSAGPGATPPNQDTNATRTSPPPRKVEPDALAPVIRRAWMRQRSRLERLPVAERVAAFDLGRYTQQLAEELLPLYLAAGFDSNEAARRSSVVSHVVNADTLRRLTAGEDAFSSTRLSALQDWETRDE